MALAGRFRNVAHGAHDVQRTRSYGGDDDHEIGHHHPQRVREQQALPPEREHDLEAVEFVYRPEGCGHDPHHHEADRYAQQAA